MRADDVIVFRAPDEKEISWVPEELIVVRRRARRRRALRRALLWLALALVAIGPWVYMVVA